MNPGQLQRCCVCLDDTNEFRMWFLYRHMQKDAVLLAQPELDAALPYFYDGISATSDLIYYKTGGKTHEIFRVAGRVR